MSCEVCGGSTMNGSSMVVVCDKCLKSEAPDAVVEIEEASIAIAGNCLRFRCKVDGSVYRVGYKLDSSIGIKKQIQQIEGWLRSLTFWMNEVESGREMVDGKLVFESDDTP